MPSDHLSLTTDKAIALKAVIQYLINDGQGNISLNEICSYHPRWRDNQKGIEEFRYFMRLNASMKIYEQEYPDVRKAVKTTLEMKGITLPEHFKDLAVYAGVAAAREIKPRPSGIPDFVDPEAISYLMGGLKSMEPFMQSYEGCWHVYRLSSRQQSSDESENATLSVGLLHIKPLSQLRHEELEIPEFSLYQRSEGFFEDIVRTYGLFLSTSQRLTLLAQGPRAVSGLSDIGIMTWRHVDTVTKTGASRRPIFGVYCLPNSDGQRMVATYFCAAFVNGSNSFTREQYEEFRQAEIDAKRIGSIELSNIEAFFKKERKSAPQILEAVKRMIDRTRDDRTFQA